MVGIVHRRDDFRQVLPDHFFRHFDRLVLRADRAGDGGGLLALVGGARRIKSGGERQHRLGRSAAPSG